MPVEGERFHDAIAERSYAISSALSHPELGIPYGSFSASGNGGQRLTVIPSIETRVHERPRSNMVDHPRGSGVFQRQSDASPAEHPLWS